jgi:hypothetical protein
MVARSVEEQVRGAQRYGELLRRVAAGALDEQAVRQRYVEFVREETGRYIRSVVSLGLSYYDDLLEAGWDYSNRFLDRLLEGGPAEATGGEPRKVAMDLRAQVGEEAVGSFVLENKRTEPSDISFIVSEFSGPPDAEAFRPPLQIDPPRFTLAPLSERTVGIRVPVLAELFRAGHAYTATIAVRGQEELELVLTVWAENGATPREQAAGAKAATSRRRAGTTTVKRSGKAASSRSAKARAGGQRRAATVGAGKGGASRSAVAKKSTRRKATDRKAHDGG